MMVGGYILEEFMEEVGGVAFDMTELFKNFKRFCTDFETVLDPTVPSKAAFFCVRTLFTIGPQSRQVKKGAKDQTWQFIFCYKGEADVDGKETPIVYRQVNVSTYKSATLGNRYFQDEDEKDLMLTVKQATMVAVEIMKEMSKMVIKMNPSSPPIMLSPLAAAGRPGPV